MQRRHFLRTTALTAGILSLSAKDLLASLLQQPAWKIRMLNKETGIFTERGGTILFTVTKEGMVVVDTQFPEQSQHLIDELKKQHSQPFRLVINTHHHGDHSSGNLSFKGIVPHVLAHKNSLKINKNQPLHKKQKISNFILIKLIPIPGAKRSAKKKSVLYYFGAAHTDGDSVVHFTRSNIAHMGDLLFNRRHPFVDRTAGANIKSWMEVLAKTVKKLDKKTKYVYGHSAEGYDITGTCGGS